MMLQKVFHDSLHDSFYTIFRLLALKKINLLIKLSVIGHCGSTTLSLTNEKFKLFTTTTSLSLLLFGVKEVIKSKTKKKGPASLLHQNHPSN